MKNNWTVRKRLLREYGALATAKNEVPQGFPGQGGAQAVPAGGCVDGVRLKVAVIFCDSGQVICYHKNIRLLTGMVASMATGRTEAPGRQDG